MVCAMALFSVMKNSVVVASWRDFNIVQYVGELTQAIGNVLNDASDARFAKQHLEYCSSVALTIVFSLT